MKISDFMDLKDLQKIQDKFSTATGLAAIAVDAEGNYITEGSNFTDFCIKYTRGSSEGLKRCVKCDTECSGTYYCHAGLIDFSADIVVDGVKLGAMIGGQVLSSEPDEEKFRGIARELNINPDQYIAALRKVPVRPEKSIYAAAEFLGEVVNRVVNLEYLKAQSSNHLDVFNEEIDSTTANVKLINEKTKQLKGISSQQNILALNASIEAARAGTIGAGFTVVSKQMGDLAKQSAGIYQEIQDLAEKINVSVHKMNA